VNSQQQPAVLSAPSVRLLDRRVEEGYSVVHEFKSHKNWVSAVAWHSDEVFTSASYDGSLKLWNIGMDVLLSTIFQHNEKVLDVNSELLVAGGSDQLLRTYRCSH
jgi:WD40 repeat protein